MRDNDRDPNRRDLFAGLALAGLLARGDQGRLPGILDDRWAWYAREAQEIADALLYRLERTTAGPQASQAVPDRTQGGEGP